MPLTKQSKGVVHWIEEGTLHLFLTEVLVLKFEFLRKAEKAMEKRMLVVCDRPVNMFIHARSNLPWQHQWPLPLPVPSLLCASPFKPADETRSGREVPFGGFRQRTEHNGRTPTGYQPRSIVLCCVPGFVAKLHDRRFMTVQFHTGNAKCHGACHAQFSYFRRKFK